MLGSKQVGGTLCAILLVEVVDFASLIELLVCVDELFHAEFTISRTTEKSLETKSTNINQSDVRRNFISPIYRMPFSDF